MAKVFQSQNLDENDRRNSEEDKFKINNAYLLDHDEEVRISFRRWLNPRGSQFQVQLGYVWVHMPQQSKWRRWHARIKDGCLHFCKNVATNEFTYCYVLYNCTFEAMSLTIPERESAEEEQQKAAAQGKPGFTFKRRRSKQYDVIMLKHKFD